MKTESASTRYSFMENLFSLDSILCSPSWCRVGLAWTSTRARTTSTTSTELANHLAVRILATKSSTLPHGVLATLCPLSYSRSWSHGSYSSYSTFTWSSPGATRGRIYPPCVRVYCVTVRCCYCCGHPTLQLHPAEFQRQMMGIKLG